MQEIPQIQVEIVVGEDRFERNINDDLIIDPNNLDEALEKQPALYAYYANRLQQAIAQKEQAEFELEKVTNEATDIARRELAEQKQRVTDKQLSAFVESQSEVQGAKIKVLAASHIRNQLYALVKAVEQKKDSLLTLAYNRRHEIDALRHKVIKAPRPISGVEDDDD